MKIQIKSPTRVDLSGGTLDCWPLYNLVPNCKTVNLAIDVFTHVELEPQDGNRIEVEIDNFNYQSTFSNIDDLISSNKKEVLLIQKILEFWRPKSGFRLKTASESPVGGGLGGSSSLCIGLMLAFEQWTNRELEDNERVKIASNIESQILRTPTGTQDYYPAFLKGLNRIDYGVEGAEVIRLSFPQQLFEDKMTLVYSGQEHHSGINNWKVLKDAVENDTQTIKALENLRNISLEMINAIEGQSWDDIPGVFEKEFIARQGLANGYATDKIHNLRDLVKSAGADEVKVCGAGGGGCVVVWSEKDKRSSIREVCEKSGFQVMDAKPVC